MDIEAVFVPTYPEPKLPDLSGLLPPELEGVTFAVSSPVPELESFQSGARASFLLTGVDLSVSYLYAWDHFPDIDSVNIAMQEVMPTVFFGVPSGITLGNSRIHVVGADFAWPIAGLDLRGEAAFFLTEDLDGSDPYVKNPWIHYVVGAGYGFSNGFTANVQLSQKYTFSFTKISEYGYILDPTNPASWNQSESYYADAYAAQFSPLISSQKGALQSTVVVHGTQRLVDDTLELGLTGIYNFPETYDDFAMAKYGDFLIRRHRTRLVTRLISILARIYSSVCRSRKRMDWRTIRTRRSACLTGRTTSLWSAPIVTDGRTFLMRSGCDHREGQVES